MNAIAPRLAFDRYRWEACRAADERNQPWDEREEFIARARVYFAHRDYMEEIQPYLRAIGRITSLCATPGLFVRHADGTWQHHPAPYPPEIQAEIDKVKGYIAEIAMSYGFTQPDL